MGRNMRKWGRMKVKIRRRLIKILSKVRKKNDQGTIT